MIVCEIGLNHKGVEPFAKQMVEQLIETNCEAITFQERENDFYKNEFEGFRLPDDFYDEIINSGNDKLFGVALANHDRINDWIEFLHFISRTPQPLANRLLTLPGIVGGKPRLVN